MYRPRKTTLIFLLVIIILLYSLFISHQSTRVVFEIDEMLKSTITVTQRVPNVTRSTSARPTRDFMDDRLQNIRDVCKRVRIPGVVTRLYAFTPKNVTYCPTYKAASTYWIQMFRFLHEDVPRHVDRPSEISKYESHLLPLKKTRRMEYFNEREHATVVSSYKFMMARDPYHRLWSVYVDKFVLLDLFFWNLFLAKIQANSGKGQSRSGRAQGCSNISFQDMVTFIIRQHKKGGNLDPHFRPMHYGCNPCIYRPDFVGKVETLTKEKEPIMKKLGLNGFDTVSDFKSHVINEMAMIIDFEYKLYRYAQKYRACLSKRNLEDRTLRAFIINGYLDENVRQTLWPRLPLGEMQFKETVSKIFLNSSRTSQEVKVQRHRIRTEAYHQLPREMLNELKDLYKYDFLLYGYEPQPVDIFNETLKEV